ncbi:MAG: RdgB/HAM1 family non-canonical purine NTP pyrophosphatase [Candidatus Marinimicrobia bacterium]|nr:RdgB/HAM1 family non-canonical purine NTP pyrophosphatase [Candidatus Neomarinimicrobiota bacterium]
MQIILATNNRHKIVEFTQAFRDFDHQVLSLYDFPQVGKINETGVTLLENSLLKARTVHKLTGLPAIADDTGLEVDALAGAPGVYSARWAGPGATYDDNNRRLLTELSHIPEEKRTARFRCIISYVDEKLELWTEGKVEGVILKQQRGTGGFGYDPVFFVPELEKTLAQLSTEEKNRISHRGLAILNFRKLFRDKIQPKYKLKE